MAVTIYDVAKMAEVSPATVSRVLNNHAYVNEEKRQRVLDIIERLQFKPNPVARNLAWANRTPQELTAAV
jgi:LacI family transcriptional regulator